MTAILVMLSVTLATEAIAQTQAPPPVGQRPPPPATQMPAPEQEKRVEGQVKAINAARTEITLTDGTRLVAPPGAALKPGVLAEGMTVVASYKEESGEKVMTELAVKEPSASPPTEPKTPGGSPTTPPGDSPKR